MSSLNPYAASYVPISRRGPAGVTGNGSENNDDDGKTVSADASVSHMVPDDFQIKNQPVFDSYGSSSPQQQNVMDNNLFSDVDHDLDIEFLRVSFPGMSEQSLRDVYNVNWGDLDAAIDMLTHLELEDGVESSGSLPETLDIGDVSESVLSADSASLKLKSVAAAEASTSTDPSAPSKLS
ncbi:hypothetical protein RIF29_12291 [Crotalaria pallida]|uniref:CUE domain-containing protein n=1 Tax=Crotalaria pallida TaxID=3830 RepID=A0AAN9IN50_CROPI